MRMGDLFRFSLRSVFVSPLRSLLTMLGLSVGIGAIIAVVALGASGRSEMDRQLSRFGINRLWITAKVSTGASLSSEDAAYLANLMRGAVVSPSRTTTHTAAAGERSAQIELVGCTRSMRDVEEIVLLRGRFFGETDEQDGARLIVLDENAAAALFPRGDSLGKKLTLDGLGFTVIGITQEKSSPFLAAAELQGRCYAPLSALERAFGEASLDEISVRAPYSSQRTRALILSAFEQRSGRGGTVAVTSLEEEIATAQRILNVFVLVLAGVAGICMLTGGIGVMNILLVSVRERRREIGVLKALGARNAHVCAQFLIEGLIFAMGGSLAGILLGLALSRLGSVIVGIPVSVPGYAYAMAVGLTCTVALLSALLPAVRAARLRPVEALLA